MIDRQRRVRLSHDIGKYVARTARNLGADPSPQLVAMLVRDLYALRPGIRASALFAEQASGLDHPLIDQARALLAEVDELETEVRTGNRSAILHAGQLARKIERTLGDLAKESQ
jgi:hypothetical protein